MRGFAPVARISARPSKYAPDSQRTRKPSPSRRISRASSSSTSLPCAMACSSSLSPSSTPLTDTKPGKFSTFGLQAICPPKAFFSITRTLLPARQA